MAGSPEGATAALASTAARAGSPDPAVAALASTAALAIAVVFAVAAWAKARRPAHRELAALRVPMPRLLAGLLPPSELGVAVLLVVRPRWGAALATVLLTAFTVPVVAAVRRGRVVSCGCFGSSSSQPVGWGTIGRNAVLVVLAATATATPSLTTPDLASVLVLTGVIVIGAVTVQLVTLWETAGRLWSVRLAGEPAGRTSPSKNGQVRRLTS